MWPGFVEEYKGHNGYQQMLARNIPVGVCEPGTS